MGDRITSEAGRPAGQVLARVLETRDLESQVQALPWPVLAKLVERVGLEDAAPLVACATPAQLVQIFDGDLWRSQRPGEDEHFDADRFLLWLEVMLEAGESVVAEKLSALPEDLVILGFERHLLVLNADAMAAQVEADDEGVAIEKALESSLGEEWEQYHLLSRRHDGWDAVFAAIVALDREHHELLMRILERCCRMTAEYAEEQGGWFEVLSRAETLEADVAGEREDRRAAAGYVAPSAASAFLRLAREPGAAPAVGRDPLTQAYFRARTRADASMSDDTDTSPPPESRDLLEVLEESGVVEAGPAPLMLTAPSPDDAVERPSLLVRAMQRLAEEDETRLFEVTEEIAYLTNVLMTGSFFRGRAMRSTEAVGAAMASCSLGLEIALQRSRASDLLEAATSELRREHADSLFRRAWAHLAAAVTRPAAEAAEGWLRAAAAASDAVESRWFIQAAGRVHAASQAATPWRALDEIDALLSRLDQGVVDGLRGLLDECPSLAGVLLGAKPGAGPRFISTLSEIATIESFLSR